MKEKMKAENRGRITGLNDAAELKWGGGESSLVVAAKIGSRLGWHCGERASVNEPFFLHGLLLVEICVGEHFWIFLLKPVGM
ncbi:hypothetical protein ANANG_G00196800 [Anguilla anguilla]|uniref:Uncharacterized protein n=1 Tax=Anguilla anguilla TaxID=7936 RepID=A0A9D3M3V1_ANGAN|nr:hypothetical protein ANANG_G00196800 [Anguilla anguilla]